MNALATSIKRAALNVLPDSDRYKCRFEIRSESSNRIYRVSYDDAPGAGYWTCSCRGNIAHGQCKHLTSIGLRGRRYGHVALDSSIKAALNG